MEKFSKKYYKLPQIQVIIDFKVYNSDMSQRNDTNCLELFKSQIINAITQYITEISI